MNLIVTINLIICYKNNIKILENFNDKIENISVYNININKFF